MNNVDYPACINELYQGEVMGEQAFLKLMAVARNERERYHFGTFLQLESETKVRLRPFLHAYGMGLEENRDVSAQVDMFVALYENNTWLDFLTELRSLVIQFLARFEEIAEAGPPQDQAILKSMVEHEAAFLYWIDKEIAGEDGALEAALSQLRHPLVH